MDTDVTALLQPILRKVYLTLLSGQVVEWVLGGVRTGWQSSAFQTALDGPAAFVSHYISLHADAAGQPEVCVSAHIAHSFAQLTCCFC